MPLGAVATAQDTKPATSQPAAAKAPTVKIIDAGTGAKQILRFTPAEGLEEVMTMTMDMAMAIDLPAGMGSQDQKMPTMKMTIANTVESVDENGDIHYAFEYRGAEVVDTPGVDPMVLGQMRQAMAAMEGTTGSGVVTSRGVSKSFTQDLDPELAQMMNMGGEFNQYLTLLPEEAMGVGAIWEVHTDMDQQGLKLTQIARYTVISMDGDMVKLKTEITQTAAAQKFAPAGSPMEMDLQSMNSTGVGESSMSLKRMMPMIATSETNTIMKMSMGEGMDMAMEIDMKMNMTSK